MGEVVSHAEFWATFAMLAWPITNQARQLIPPLHVPTQLLARDFAGMNPTECYRSKVDEDAQEFTDEIYKVLAIIGVYSKEKVELDAYQLKEVAQVWFTQWLAKRMGDDRVGWEDLKFAFLDHFFSLEHRETKLTEFINLK